jgi:glycosyltransferase involved in cell wall biosynthesis
MPIKIIAIAQVPPPVIGFSLISERFIGQMRTRHDVEACNIAAAPGTKGLRKLLSRVGRTLSACGALVRHVRVPDRRCYVACEGNWGLIYTGMVLLAARLLGYRTYLHHHSFRYIDTPDRLMRFLLGIGGPVHHVFLCNVMHERFERAYGPVIGSVVSNAAFVDPVPVDDLPSPGPTLVLGHLSNLTREKGLHTFLDLLRAALADGMDVRGILAGPINGAEDRALVEQAQAELGVRLDYRGSVYGEAKASFYRDTEIFVFPTRYVNEAQPTVLFEAISAGHAVLSYDRGCIASQVGECGLVVARDGEFVAPALAWLKAHATDDRVRSRGEIVKSYAFLNGLARQSAATLFDAPANARQSATRTITQ